MKQYTDEELLTIVREYMEQLDYAREPRKLYAPIDYVLPSGGKRVRPVLMLLAYNLYKEDVSSILSQAAGLETYHNFTLLHDDLMDGAERRRGLLAVHKKWDTNTAILSGDAMLILAYRFVQQGCAPQYLNAVMQEFTQAALEVCEGQQWDVDFETRTDVTVEEYIEMIRLKTSVLLGVALKIGAVLAGASSRNAGLLYDFGVKIGLAFQLQDDFLDVYGDPMTFGKNIGGDILSNKKTFMLITAQQLAKGKDAEELKSWIEAKEFDGAEKIRCVTEIYNRLNIARYCREKIEELYAESLDLLAQVEVKESHKEKLRAYAVRLMGRNK